jgi:hypothetical protein
MNKKLIIANGCSMASGFECTVIGEQHDDDWQYSWPTKVAENYNIDHINLSRAGQSNYSISINLQTEILKALKTIPAKDILVIVGWTEFTRSEFITDKYCLQLNAGLLDNILKKRMPNNISVELQNMLEHAVKGWVAQSIDSHVNKFIWLYWGLIHFLKNHNIEYFFFNAMNTPYCPNRDPILCDHKNLDIGNSVRDVWDVLINDPCYMNNVTQFDWLTSHSPDCKIGEGIGQSHWNPEALAKWANYLISKIDLIE